MRRYASRLPNVTFIDEAGVRGVLARRDASGALMAEGLKVEREARSRKYAPM